MEGEVLYMPEAQEDWLLRKGRTGNQAQWQPPLLWGQEETYC